MSYVSNMYLICFYLLQYLFYGLFYRFFFYFLLAAKRYPMLWSWGFTDFSLKDFWGLRLRGLQNTERDTRI